MQLILQAFCSSLFTLGICFVIIELSSKLNRNFLNFGIVIILLSIFSSMDIWVLANNGSTFQYSLQHAIFCPVPYLIFIYLANILKLAIPKRKIIFFYCSLASLILFSSGVMFKNSNGTVVPTFLYYATFVPLLAVIVVNCISILINALRSPSINNKSFIILHLAGFVIFAVFALLDLLMFLSPELREQGVSYTIVGAIILGFILTYVFTKNLILLIKDRMIFTDKLQAAYKELESARNLSELGKSTSIINHEILNYCFVIKGYAEILNKTAHLEPHHQAMLETILASIDDMSRFSKEILEFSKAKTISNRPIPIYSLLKSSIENNFYDHQDTFALSDFNKEVMIQGDWKKLEQAFSNLFTNALEAKASLITLKTISSQMVVLVTIEDNGIGCKKEDLPSLFSAFFSTKNNGTGLGLATTRAIIEGHGGHISVISKNVISEGNDHGCIFSITFPTAAESNTIKDNIVFIEENTSQLSSVISTFRNVHVNPNILPAYKDFDHNRFKPSEYKIVGSPRTIQEIKENYPEYHCFTIVESLNKQLFTLEIKNKETFTERPFTEEYVITHIAGVSPQNQ